MIVDIIITLSIINWVIEMHLITESFINLFNRKIVRIIFVTIVCVSLLAIFIYGFVNGQPKEPLTCEQFDMIGEQLGYDVKDSTQEYLDEFGSSLKGSRGIHSNVLRFEFFEFTDKETPHAVWTSCYQKIIENRSRSDIEYENYYANYRQYALKSLGRYYTVIYVGNTAVFAECSNEESIEEILNILAEMKYNPKNSENKK